MARTCWPDAQVAVCELIPEIADWNRGPLAHLAGHPLDDSRTRLVIGDAASPEFERTLALHLWTWRREDIALVPGRVDAMHHIYSCSRNLALLGQRLTA